MLAAELVVHLFTPSGDSRAAERGYDQLRRVWYASREAIGVTSAAPGLGVPADLPASPADLVGLGHSPGDTVVASQQAHPDSGVLQTVLRRQPGLLCLSALLAPPPSAEVGWPELDALWTDASSALQSELIDEARIYQGLLPSFDVFAHYPRSATAELASRSAAELPDFDRAAGWERRGVTTITGFAVWELAAGGDYRPSRRFMITAAAAREAALGAWTWSSGGTAPPPLQLYLAEASKVRLQGRVWTAGAPAVEHLRRRLDEGARQLGGDLAQAGLLGSGPSTTVPVAAVLVAALAERLAQLRSDVLQESAARTSLLDVERNARIAAANMRAMTTETVIPTGSADPFEEDQRCAQHLVDLLGDSQAFLSSAGVRARAAVHAAEQAGLTATDGASIGDPTIAGEDRLAFLDELADLYADSLKARHLVEGLGVPRGRLPVAGGLNPRTWWGETFRELESGILAAPFRDLLSAALADYSHNTQLRHLASRYGIPLRQSRAETSTPGATTHLTKDATRVRSGQRRR